MSSPSPDHHPVEPGPADETWCCYRHPDREVGVRCTRCERPICPDCMVQASVGFHCPECVRGAPAVRSVRSLRSLRSDPYLTYVIIVLNVLAFLPSVTARSFADGSRGDLAADYALFGPAVAAGEWWRIVTSGFLHGGLIHLFFNMFILYQLGLMLEPVVGRVRFGLVYAAGLVGGAFGALLLDPNALTVGASGAVFGLMGAAVVGMRWRGINPMQSGIGGLLLLNLVLTFAIPGISIGGHLGGLVGGALAGLAVFGTDDLGRAGRWAGAVAAALVVAVGAAGAVVTASTPLWPF